MANASSPCGTDGLSSPSHKSPAFLWAPLWSLQGLPPSLPMPVSCQGQHLFHLYTLSTTSAHMKGHFSMSVMHNKSLKKSGHIVC